MYYTYTCKKCNHSEEKSYSIKEELPKRLNCSNCESKESMFHDFKADISSTATKIPDNFRAHKMDSEMNFGKMGRDQRTYF